MSVQYGRKCLSCNNTRYRSKQCRLFRFPVRGSPMWGKWLAALGLNDADIDTQSNEPPRLCQLHFEPKDFLQRKLSAMAVPKQHALTREEKKKKKVVLGHERTMQIITEVIDETPKPTGEYLSNDGLVLGLESGEVSGSGISQHVDCETLSNGQDDLFEADAYEYGSSCVSSLDDSVEHSDAASESPLLASRPKCKITQHETLAKQLKVERARIQELQEENAQQRNFIEAQRKLLMQLGVQYTTLDEPEGDS